MSNPITPNKTRQDKSKTSKPATPKGKPTAPPGRPLDSVEHIGLCLLHARDTIGAIIERAADVLLRADWSTERKKSCLLNLTGRLESLEELLLKPLPMEEVAE